MGLHEEIQRLEKEHDVVILYVYEVDIAMAISLHLHYMSSVTPEDYEREFPKYAEKAKELWNDEEFRETLSLSLLGLRALREWLIKKEFISDINEMQFDN